MNKLGTRALALAGTAVVGGLLLAACGDDSDDSDEDTSATTEAETGTTEEPAEEADQGEQVTDGDVTPEGTALALGDPATLPVEDGEGVVTMTVESIEPGDVADMADFDLDDGVEGMVPFYVTYSFTKVSGSELEGVGPESDAGALLGDGSAAQELALVGAFDPCDTEYAPAEFDEGQSYESCRVYLAPEGEAVGSVGFYGDYESPYYENPVTWE